MRRFYGYLPLLILFLGAFALRVFRLDFQSLWYDEAFSVYLAHFSLADITARTAADIQPPLYYYLLHFWVVLTGEREFALRMLSLFFGVLTIPLMYVTTRRLSSTAAASAAALLAALSPLYLWYSQETRMYTLITFLLLLSSYALLRGLIPDAPVLGPGRPLPILPGEGRGGWGVRGEAWWIVFALANIAAVYTHYFAFVVIAFQLLFGLVYALGQGARRLALLGRMVTCFAVVIVAFLPWMPFVVARLGQDASYWPGALKLDEALRHILINFASGESVLEAQGKWIGAVWLGIFCIGLLAWWAAERRANVASGFAVFFAILYLVVPLALLLVLFSRNPKFNARYLMIASPGLYLWLGVTLASWLALARRRGIVVRVIGTVFLALTGVALLATSIYADANAFFDPAFTKASFREVAQYVDDHIASREAILLTSGHLFPAFDYYYRGDAAQIRLPDDPTLNTDHVLDYQAGNVLNESLAGRPGVWVVLWQDEVVDPNGFVPMLLSSHGTEVKIEGTSFYQVRLRHWVLAPDAHFDTAPRPGVARSANFKDKVEMLGFDAPDPTPADQGASFNLYWQVHDTLADDYQVALRVRDAAGNLWGKQDRRPAGYNYPTTRWEKGESLFGSYTVPLLAGAPAGDYFAEVTLYTVGDPSGLDVLAPNGAPAGKTVKIGPIAVLPAAKPASYASLGIQNNISQPLGPFTLLGYQLGRDKASAGESLPLSLYWRADQPPAKDYSLRIRFGDIVSDPLPLANAAFPTGKWREGEIVRGQYLVPIPAEAKPGTVDLQVVLGDVGALALAPFTVEKTDRVFVRPTAQFAQKVIFGDNALALAGYDLDTQAKPGGTLKLTLVWQALSKMDKAYTVFVHLLDKDGKVAAQKDAQPASGARPTTGWIANEYVADAYDLALKPDVPPGTYQIEIGWYEAPSFARLAVLDENGAPAGDHVILKTTVLVQ